MTPITTVPVASLRRPHAGSSGLTQLPPLALYIHLPWCLRKCPYCDFNSHEAPDGGLQVQPRGAPNLRDLLVPNAKGIITRIKPYVRGW